MSRWKELPDSQDQRVRQLVVQLRRLKDRSGLSLVSLAAQTGYSRSSWDRYLNGKALPPRRAVEELVRAAGADPIRLLVLHEVAEETWQQPTAPSAPAGAKDEGRRGAGGEAAAEPFGAAEGSAASEEETAQPPVVSRPVALAAVVAAALVGLGAGMLIAAPWGDDGGAGSRAKSASTGLLPSSSAISAAEGPGRL